MFITGKRGTVIIDEADAWVLRSHYVNAAMGNGKLIAGAKQKTGKASFQKLGRILLNAPKDAVVDHINGDPLDNRRINIRCVSPKQNSQNRAKRSDVSSAFKGVSKNRDRWFACLYENYKRVSLGYHTTEVAAAHAYDAEARKRFGQCAALNFPRAGEQSAHRPKTNTFHTQEATPCLTTTQRNFRSLSPANKLGTE